MKYTKKILCLTVSVLFLINNFAFSDALIISSRANESLINDLAAESRLSPMSTPEFVDVVKLTAAAIAVVSERNGDFDRLKRNAEYDLKIDDIKSDGRGGISRRGDLLTYCFREKRELNEGSVVLFPCAIEGETIGDGAATRWYICRVAKTANGEYDYDFFTAKDVGAKEALTKSAVEKLLRDAEMREFLAKKQRSAKEKAAIARFVEQQNNTDRIIRKAIASGTETRLDDNTGPAVSILGLLETLGNTALYRQFESLVKTGQLMKIPGLEKPHAGGIGIYLPDSKDLNENSATLHELFAKCGFTHEECKTMEIIFERWILEKGGPEYTGKVSVKNDKEKALLEKAQKTSFDHRWHNPFTVDYYGLTESEKLVWQNIFAKHWRMTLRDAMLETGLSRQELAQAIAKLSGQRWFKYYATVAKEYIYINKLEDEKTQKWSYSDRYIEQLYHNILNMPLLRPDAGVDDVGMKKTLTGWFRKNVIPLFMEDRFSYSSSGDGTPRVHAYDASRSMGSNDPDYVDSHGEDYDGTIWVDGKTIVFDTKLRDPRKSTGENRLIVRFSPDKTICEIQSRGKKGPVKVEFKYDGPSPLVGFGAGTKNGYDRNILKGVVRGDFYLRLMADIGVECVSDSEIWKMFDISSLPLLPYEVWKKNVAGRADIYTRVFDHPEEIFPYYGPKDTRLVTGKRAPGRPEAKGKNAQDARTVILRSPRLRQLMNTQGWFTLDDYIEGYKEVYRSLGFTPPSERSDSKTIFRSDLKKLADAGFLKIDESGKAFVYIPQPGIFNSPENKPYMFSDEKIKKRIGDYLFRYAAPGFSGFIVLEDMMFDIGATETQIVRFFPEVCIDSGYQADEISGGVVKIRNVGGLDRPYSSPSVKESREKELRKRTTEALDVTSAGAEDTASVAGWFGNNRSFIAGVRSYREVTPDKEISIDDTRIMADKKDSKLNLHHEGEDMILIYKTGDMSGPGWGGEIFIRFSPQRTVCKVTGREGDNITEAIFTYDIPCPFAGIGAHDAKENFRAFVRTDFLETLIKDIKARNRSKEETTILENRAYLPVDSLPLISYDPAGKIQAEKSNITTRIFDHPEESFPHYGNSVDSWFRDLKTVLGDEDKGVYVEDDHIWSERDGCKADIYKRGEEIVFMCHLYGQHDLDPRGLYDPNMLRLLYENELDIRFYKDKTIVRLVSRGRSDGAFCPVKVFKYFGPSPLVSFGRGNNNEIRPILRDDFRRQLLEDIRDYNNINKSKYLPLLSKGRPLISESTMVKADELGIFAMKIGDTGKRFPYYGPADDMFLSRAPATTEGISNEEIMDFIEDGLSVSLDEINDTIGRFHSEMEKGLVGEKSSLLMEPSYSEPATGKEKGVVITLDLGGTNFRVLKIELEGNGKITEPVISKYVINEKLIKGDQEALFDFIAGCIDSFLEEHDMGTVEDVPLSFVFSFPVEKAGPDSGILKKWVKEFEVEGAVGEDVVDLLSEAFERKGLQDKISVSMLANDTEATLQERRYKDQNCDLGVIFGTGTNGAYVENLLNILKYKGSDTPTGKMIVNMEWGNFNKLRLTPYDVQLDRMSADPGGQIFEKIVGGKYIGENARLIIRDLISRGVLFEGKGSQGFSDNPEMAWVFNMKYISRIVEDISAGYNDVGLVLEELGIMDSTVGDRERVRKICDSVLTRAARLGAMAIAATITKMDPDLKRNHTVSVDGTPYRECPEFARRIRQTLGEIFDEKASRIKLVTTEDATGIGGGVMGIRARLQRKAAASVEPADKKTDEIDRITASMPGWFREAADFFGKDKFPPFNDGQKDHYIQTSVAKSGEKGNIRFRRDGYSGKISLVDGREIRFTMTNEWNTVDIRFLPGRTICELKREVAGLTASKVFEYEGPSPLAGLGAGNGLERYNKNEFFAFVKNDFLEKLIKDIERFNKSVEEDTETVQRKVYLVPDVLPLIAEGDKKTVDSWGVISHMFSHPEESSPRHEGPDWKKVLDTTAVDVAAQEFKGSVKVKNKGPVFFMPQQLMNSPRAEEVAKDFPGAEFVTFNQYDTDNLDQQLSNHKDRRKVVITLGIRPEDVLNIYRKYNDLVPLNFDMSNIQKVLGMNVRDERRQELERTVLTIALLAAALPAEGAEGTKSYLVLKQLLSLVLPKDARADTYINMLIDVSKDSVERLTYIINTQLKPIVKQDIEKLRYIVSIYIAA